MNDTSHKFRNAAILVSCLTDREADELLESMDPADAGRIRATLQEMDGVDPREQDRVLADFLRTDAGFHEGPTDGVEMDLSFEGRIAAEDEPIATDPDMPLTVPARVVESADGDLLARALQDEHPQTIAVVLARQAPERASQLLMRLPLATQADVARRLTSIQLPAPTLLDEIDLALEAKLAEQSASTNQHATVTTWDQILEAVDPRERQSLLQRLSDLESPAMPASDGTGARRDDGEAQVPPASSQPFTFADLALLDDTCLLQVLAAVDRQIILLALTGAPRPLVERLLAQVPEHEARLFEQRCESIGPLSLRDVEFAQQTIVRCAIRLAEQGTIRSLATSRKQQAA